MSSLNCSLLVHTFNQYERYWDGCLNGFAGSVPGEFTRYFGTDEKGHAEHDFRGFQVIYSGKGEWSDRLVKLLEQIPTDYVWYQQEDMWPCKTPPNLSELMQIMVENDLLRLQISPIVQYYSLCGAKIPLFFHYKSKYLVSHQPSIWKKSFLLECLKPNEDPWKNEYLGTQRLNHEGIAGKIAIIPADWYSHQSVKTK